MMSIMTDLTHWLVLRAWPEPRQLRPGERGKLLVEVQIPADCHIEAHEPPEPFLIPTVLSLEPVEGVTIEPIHYPPAQERQLNWSPLALQVYRDRVQFEAPIAVAADAAVGQRRIRGQLRYQGCTPNACLPPNTQLLEATLEVGSKG